MSSPPAARSESPLLLREDREGIATLVLNRPARQNALCEALIDELQRAADALAADPEIRVVVLAASGPAFCAGHDLREMRARPELGYYRALFASCTRMMLSLAELPQPVIARVQGVATAAGCQLVATCDLAVASQQARFATSGIDVGLFCATPGVPLSRNVSRKRAFEMLVTGAFVDAATALDWGLVNRVVPAPELDAAALELARTIASKSPVAVRAGKRLFARQLAAGLEEAYALACETMARNLLAEDAGEGIDAFLAKRKPVWRGR
jgi:enoyl-CoA hydratase/carnithine racemase